MDRSTLKERISRLSTAQKSWLQQLLVEEGHIQSPESRQKQLVAYVLSGPDQDQSTLKQYLSEQLPDYMVPASIQVMDQFPRLPNGKIDIQALPDPFNSEMESEGTFVPPGTEMEKKLVKIWEEILHIQPIGIQDNFFEIGGDSMLSIQIVAQARKEGIPMEAHHIFQYQSIGSLASVLGKSTQPKRTVQDFSVAKPVVFPEGLQLTDEKRAEIEAIFPLSPMQSAYLYHNLYAGHSHLGFVQVYFRLEGALDRQAMESAWKGCMQNQPVLRTALYWEGLENPVQAVFKELQTPIEYLDWTKVVEAEMEDQLKALLAADRQEGYAFDQAPILRLKLIQTAARCHYLTWSSHHILVDGWAWSILFREVFERYQALVQNKGYNPELRPDFADFIEWQQGQDLKKAAHFWRKKMAGLARNHYLAKESLPVAKPTVSIIKEQLSFEESQAIQEHARKHHLTLNSLVQGAWAFLLSLLSGEKDLVFGKTVSGRSVPFAGIESMVGLFTNTLPVRIWLFENMNWGEWMEFVQQDQIESQPFEQSPLHLVQQWAAIKNSRRLFESLIIFQNYQEGRFEELWDGELAVEITAEGTASTFPVTLMILPGKQLEIHLSSHENHIAAKLASQILASFKQILVDLPQLWDQDLMASQQNYPQVLKLRQDNEHTDSGELRPTEDASYTPPSGKIELALTRIWESLFNRHPIGAMDHFFEIGGTSMVAIQLFAKIKDELGKNLPPISLLSHPTIRELAKLIQLDEEPGSWSSLVPMRVSGNKKPLFCIHAGGAHVFFYNALVHHLDAEQPVYALQPIGLDGQQQHHESIEEMARHYLAEIQAIQPEGPYAFASICYGNPINLEMCRMLREMGEEIGLLAIVDSAPGHLFAEPPMPDLQGRMGQFAKRLTQNPIPTLRKSIEFRLKKWTKSAKSVPKASQEAQDSPLKQWQDTMVEAYKNYEWPPYEGEVCLIRTTESVEGQYNERHLAVWKDIAQGGLKTHVIPGSHRHIFEEPEVQGLATKLQECLDKAFKPASNS